MKLAIAGGGFAALESRDGKYLYYAKGRSVEGLWRVRVDGTEEQLVLEEEVEAESWEALAGRLSFNPLRDALIGADGLWSRVRQAVVGDGKRTDFTSPKVRYTPEERIKDMDALVIVATGGRGTEALSARYPQPNIVVRDFVDPGEARVWIRLRSDDGSGGSALVGSWHSEGEDLAPLFRNARMRSITPALSGPRSM